MPARARRPDLTATWDQVLARRVATHHLDAPATDGLVPLVRRLCGVHAQLGSSAEAAVWLRTGGAVGPVDVRRALVDERTLVKTWALRGTLHLLPAADLPIWAAALGTRSFPGRSPGTTTTASRRRTWPRWRRPCRRCSPAPR